MPFLSGADFHVGESSGEILHCKLNHKNHRFVMENYCMDQCRVYNYIYVFIVIDFLYREIIIGKNQDAIDLTKLITVKTISDSPETQGSFYYQLLLSTECLV